jgi:hypothetical protein
MKLAELIMKLGDEQYDRKKFQQLCRTIFSYLSSKKIKDLPLFIKKTGTEYSLFYDSLDFEKEMKDDLLSNDEYFDLVIEESKKFKK